MTVPKVYHDTTTPLTTEELERRISSRLNSINDYFTPERMEAVLLASKPKEIAVMEAIYLDKLTAIRTPPAQVIQPQQQAKLDEVFSALLTEMKRRGLQAKLTERTAVLTAS